MTVWSSGQASMGRRARHAVPDLVSGPLSDTDPKING
jgi:hypothetical protein